MSLQYLSHGKQAESFRSASLALGPGMDLMGGRTGAVGETFRAAPEEEPVLTKRPPLYPGPAESMEPQWPSGRTVPPLAGLLPAASGSLVGPALTRACGASSPHSSLRLRLCASPARAPRTSFPRIVPPRLDGPWNNFSVPLASARKQWQRRRS